MARGVLPGFGGGEPGAAALYIGASQPKYDTTSHHCQPGPGNGRDPGRRRPLRQVAGPARTIPGGRCGGFFRGYGCVSMLGSVTAEEPRPVPPRTTPVAAFFDLDKTIIARSSAYAFGRQFMESGMITASGMMQMALGQAMFISGGHDHDQMEAARDQLSSMVAGWRADHVRRIAEESLHQVISPYVYKEAVELIRHHRALGHGVFIVSASATELVEPIAAALGVGAGECVATRLEIVDGVYTGEVPFFCRGDNKATEMRRIAAERGYDLSRCYAYSDSGTDEPMLATVGHPVAVNPDKALRKIAEERHWPIRIFRNPEPLFRRTGPAVTGIAAAVGAAALIAGIIASRRPPKGD